MMTLIKLTKMTLATAVVAAASFTSQAITIDFGTTWPTFTAVKTGNYSSDPYDPLLANSNTKIGPEADIATFINSVVGSTFTGPDVHKTNLLPADEIAGPDGYFAVPSGWDYL